MKSQRRNTTCGATIIELLLVITIIGIFARIITLNLFQGQQRTSLVVARDSVISDVRKQQLRAMHGDTDVPETYLDFSVLFEAHRYILYPGIVYDELNPFNEVINLDSILEFNPIDLPSSIVTFARLSGDVRSFDPMHRSVTLVNTQTGDQHQLTFNERGIPLIE